MANRARWVMKYEKGLVDVLHENNVSHYRTPNGWRTDGWRKIVRDFNDRHQDAGFSKVQIQEHETQLKKDYKLIKSILQRDGVSWGQNASMIRTTDEIWDEIIDEAPKARKYQSSFPLLQSLELLFERDIPEDDRNLTSSVPQHVVGMLIRKAHFQACLEDLVECLLEALTRERTISAHFKELQSYDHKVWMILIFCKITLKRSWKDHSLAYTQSHKELMNQRIRVPA